MTLRLLLGDDHTLVRQGFRKILEERSGWQIVAEVGDGLSAVQQSASLVPDVAILDIGMPKLNGIEAAQQIASCSPGVRVLIVSMYADEAYVTRALQAGVVGYLLKDAAGSELIKAVEFVARGQAFFSAPIAKLMLDDYRRRVSGTRVVDRFETLTAREREIVQLIVDSRTNREVARILAISTAAVETHRARILEKLGVHNAAELVRYATRRSFLDHSD
ncbi:MAG TPA: response regulator transcription factor [Gemmatimonadaceae bacterium]|nr:response regulator transcription factor [Gemmatimonadaceae bacterium]